MEVRGVRGLWNCVAMEQSGYIREWQNLLLTLSSLYIDKHIFAVQFLNL